MPRPYEIDVEESVTIDGDDYREPWEEPEARTLPVAEDDGHPFSIEVYEREDDESRIRNIVAPADTDELKTVIQEARAAGVALKPVAHVNKDQGHSFSKIVEPADYQLSLRRLADSTYDPATKRITVAAGERIRDAIDVLRPHGRALPNMGAYTGQTLVGAVCTDTHGSGVYDDAPDDHDTTLGPFSTLVQSFTLMGEDGEERTIDRDADPEMFRAAVVGLGCFGVVTSVTVDTVPAYRLRETRTFGHWKNFRDKLPGLIRAHRHVSVAISPYMDLKGRPMLLTKRDRTDEQATTPMMKHRSLSFWLTKNAGHLTAPLLERRMLNKPKRRDNLLKTAMQSGQDAKYVQDWDKVLQLGMNVLRYHSCEIGIELDDDGKWVDVVDAVLTKLHPWVSPRWEPTAPLSLRFVGPSDAYMSPQYKRKTVMFEIPFLVKQWGLEADARTGIREIHDFLVQEHGGRPHWGKVNWMTWNDVMRVYDGHAIGKWLDHYAAANTSGLWNNPFTDRLGISR